MSDFTMADWMMQPSSVDGLGRCAVRIVAGSGVGDLRVAGVRVARRLARTLEVAGYGPASAAGGGGRRLLVVAADAVVDPPVLDALLERAEGDVVVAECDDERAPAVAVLRDDSYGMPRNADDIATVVARADKAGRLQRVHVPEGVCRRVRNRREVQAVGQVLLAGLRRPTDGLFARYVDRRLSARLSLVLVRMGIRPNPITLIATLVGLAGAVLLASPVHSWRIWGALIVVLSTVLDGCDGEVARLTMRASDAGRRLDLIGDNLVNGAVFVAIGSVCVRSDSSELMVVVAGVMLVGIMIAAATGFWFSGWIDRVGLGDHARIWYERLTSRDFVYLVLVLAVIDKLEWFLWAAAIGTYVFSLTLVALKITLSRSPSWRSTIAVSAGGVRECRRSRDGVGDGKRCVGIGGT